MKYRELTQEELEVYNVGYKNGSRQAVIKIIEFESPEEKKLYRQGYNAGCQDRKRKNVILNKISNVDSYDSGCNVSNVSNVCSYDSAIAIANTIAIEKKDNRGVGKEGKKLNLDSRDEILSASPKEILDAIKEQVVPNLGAYFYFGDVPEEELVKYVQNRVAGKWMNKTGRLIFNIGSDLAQWMKNAKPVEEVEDKDVNEFVDKWNSIVYKGCKSASQFANVKEAEAESVKPYVKQAKKKLVEIIESVKKKQAEGKKAYFVVDGSMEDVWGFGMKALMKRRFWSDFLYNTVMLTPKFFCSAVKEIADPYSDEYLNESQKYYHG